MSIEAILSQCEAVRSTSHGKYVARCPAHDDRSPSLAITSCDDGRILIHCFAGCETEDVLAAVGLTFADVMPERIGSEHRYKPVRQRFDARQVLAGITHELTVVVLIIEKYISAVLDEDEARLMLAAERINSAIKAGPPLRTPPEFRRTGSRRL